jgi:hypothetical protein
MLHAVAKSDRSPTERGKMIRVLLSGFTVGVFSFLIFHQGSLFFFQHVSNGLPIMVEKFGRATASPFNLNPVPHLFSIPIVVLQSFWSGIWGALLALFMPNRLFVAFVLSTIFGSILVSMFTFGLIPIFLLMDGIVFGLNGNSRHSHGTAFLVMAPGV